nr:MAG TPA: hypothetical protein [Caudoviricetes sp.]
MQNGSSQRFSIPPVKIKHTVGIGPMPQERKERAEVFESGVVLWEIVEYAKVTGFYPKPRKVPRRSAPLPSRADTKAS